MSAERNVEVVERLFHVGRSSPNAVSVLRELFAEDFVCHGPPTMNHDHSGGTPLPIESCMFNNALAEVSFAIEDMNSEDDRVTARFRATGRHVAELQGVAPTNESLSISGLTTFRLEEGRIAEGWGTLNFS